MKAKQKKQSSWRNRITGSGEQPANQFLAHEANARRHPAAQRDALRGSLDELGWVAPVIISKRSGKILDGHARVEEALTKDENAPVPYVEVDVSEAEEKLILASYDPITGLATYDREALDGLLRDVQTGEAALQEMLAGLAAEQGVVDIGSLGSDFTLPNGDRAPFQQMTFTLADAQAEEIKQALRQAMGDSEFDKLPMHGNENSNGNAFYLIVTQWQQQKTLQ